MVKETKRKTFKFYRSYFDIFNELENDEDKLGFIQALLNKQFLGIDPELKGIVKFAYISQLHSIEKQVKGWEDATNLTLSAPSQHPPMGLPPHPPMEEQVKEKEQVQVKVKGEVQPIKIGGVSIVNLKNEEFENFWNYYDKKVNKMKTLKKWVKLSKDDIAGIKATIKDYIKSTPDKNFRKDPLTYLNY